MDNKSTSEPNLRPPSPPVNSSADGATRARRPHVRVGGRGPRHPPRRGPRPLRLRLLLHPRLVLDAPRAAAARPHPGGQLLRGEGGRRRRRHDGTPRGAVRLLVRPRVVAATPATRACACSRASRTPPAGSRCSTRTCCSSRSTPGCVPVDKCSYVPPSCHRDPSENARNVSGWAARWRRSLELSASFPCYFDGQLRPDDVILDRDDSRAVVFHCVFWPFIILLVGLLLIGLATCAKSLAVRAEAMRKFKKLR
ncbi:uncharacterized protein LOC133347965 [Lethenteron reissneri]|uniref:uncharacterized protein LOC133347965 n=1 Tax=Lethenteron reissneri TaxID=7753 RepID=UPI002AB66D91|nr:uncharacterized protein LOC133347965 [Lethenteron reissneri]